MSFNIDICFSLFKKKKKTLQVITLGNRDILLNCKLIFIKWHRVISEIEISLYYF